MSIGTKITDYNSYFSAFKGNYRKGANRFRTILENPATAEEFSTSLGGTCVVLGWPIGKDDRNSQELLSILKESSVISQSVLTWLGQWYPEYNQDADTMYGDAARCAALEADPLTARAVAADPVALGKLVVALSGGDCTDYDNINAVVSSPTAMEAVAAAPAALQALIVNPNALAAAVSSQMAMTAIIDNSTALNTVVGSQVAMAAVAASQTAMTAVAASQTAMTAIWLSETALAAVKYNDTAWETFTGASSEVVAKTVAILADLDPSDYDDMEAVAASSTAMAAVAASQTAMTAVAASQTALTALAASSVAVEALIASPLCSVYSPVNKNAWRTDTFTGSGILIRVCNYQASGGYYKIDGGSTVNITEQRADIVKAYQSSLEVYWVCYSGPADRGIYRIVLSGT